MRLFNYLYKIYYLENNAICTKSCCHETVVVSARLIISGQWIEIFSRLEEDKKNVKILTSQSWKVNLGLRHFSAHGIVLLRKSKICTTFCLLCHMPQLQWYNVGFL